MPESLDRAGIRAMLEDHWRTKFTVALQNHKLAQEMPYQLTRQINTLAASMAADRAQEFVRVVNEERDALLEEHERNHVMFARRLGVDITRPNMRSNRQDIGDMAVRTAVRASIWEGIRRLFRR